MMKNSKKITLWAALAAFVACLAARMYQIVGCTNMNSGFLYHDCGFGGYLFYIVAALTLAAGLFVGMRDFPKDGSFSTAKDVTDARACLIGFPTLVVGLLALVEGYFELSAVTPSLFLQIVDFALGALMVAAAFVTLYKKEFAPWLGLMYCSLPLYFVLHCVYLMTIRMAIITVPEYLIELVSEMLLALFFVQAAMVLVDYSARGTRIAMCVTGVSGAAITLGSAVAAMLCKVAAPAEIANRVSLTTYDTEIYFHLNKGKNAYMLTFTAWVDVAAAVLAVITMAVLLLPKKKDSSN